MKIFFRKLAFTIFVVSAVFILSGCTVVLQKGRTSDIEKIVSLSDEVKRLKMTEEEYLKLKQAYDALAESLSKEIGEKKVSLGIEQKGLVITFVDSVLFDSGKAQLRLEAAQTLDKVVAVCLNIVADRDMGIEGHTDNEPIKYSGWKSNWELSTARATSVLHYLVDKGISPERLQATGFGEYHPLASNETLEGRQKNRRVEIVILPEKVVRVKETPKKIPKSTYVK